MKRLVLPLFFSIILVSSCSFNYASAIPSVTSVSLDEPAQKAFPVMQGETMTFTGRLIKASSLAGISNATINIVQQVAFGQTTLLASGRTDVDGYYAIPWVVDVALLAGVTGGSTGSDPTQGRENRFQVVVVARYDGDDQYLHDLSNAQSFEVRLNALTITVESKKSFLAYEKVIVKVMVNDGNSNLVDPDKITARFDNSLVTLLKQSTGVYYFSVESLTPGSHQLQLLAEKIGHTPDDELISFDAMKRRTSLALSTDKSSYETGETVTITASLIDQSANELVRDRTVSGALTTPGLAVKQLTFIAGRATYKVENTDPAGTWLVSAGFAGDNSYFGVASQVSFTVTKVSAVSPPQPTEVVSISRPMFVDQAANTLRDAEVGQQVMIQTKVTSKFATTEGIAYISQVKDKDGITVALSWITSTLAPGQSLELAVSWIPEAAGEYTTEVFVWKSIKDPQPLSFNVEKSTIVVS